MYRILRTVYEAKGEWHGLCAVVTLKEFLIMPDGSEHEYTKTKKQLTIKDGPHKGVYSLEKIFT